MTERGIKNGIIKNLKNGSVWLSVVTCFMLFLYAPLELLFLNQDEFWFDAYQIVSVMFFVFAGACAVSIVFFFLLRKWNETLYRIGLVAYFIVFVCFYVQGNILTAGLPLLDGSTIDWSLYKKEYMQSYVLWIAVTVIVILIYRKGKCVFFEKMVKIVSICMTLMFCVTLITLALGNHGLEKKLGLAVTERNMLQMSKNQNFVILMLDAVDATAMNEILESDTKYQDIFTDFTFYENVLGAYPATMNSIPFIFSGEWYENEVEFKEYEAKAYAESPIFRTLEDAGWSLGVYEGGMLVDDIQKERFDNVIPSQRGFTDNLLFINWQMKLVGFRYLPYRLKQYSYIKLRYLVELKNPPEGENIYSSANRDFYQKILEEEISYTDQDCFRFIHISGGHEPFTLNEKVEEVAPEDGSYQDNIKASLTVTKEYLEKLKKAGVYDNSVIIIMADHGWSDQGVKYYGHQNPIFFVKGKNEKHDYKISDAPISYVDLQGAFARLLEGAESDQIFEWRSGDQRERRYLFYEHRYHLIEQIQPGHASDAEAMYETGNRYDFE